MQIELAKFDSSQPELSIGELIGGDNGGVVVARLGDGAVATVWRVDGVGTAAGGNSSRAIKVYGDKNTRHFRNEVKLYERLREYGGNEITNVIAYYGVFAHIIMHKHTPYIHPCISLELCAWSLSAMTKFCVNEFGGGLPREMITKIMHDLFSGLDFLHSIGIIHGDINPKNVLITRGIDEIHGPDDIHAKITDIGSGFIAGTHAGTIGTIGYLAPEILSLGADADTPLTSAVDIWAAFATCFYLINGEKLFDVDFRGLDYGSDVNSNSNAPVAMYIACEMCQQFDTCEKCRQCTYCAAHMLCTDNASLDSCAETEVMLNYRYMVLVAKVIGYPSDYIAESLPDYYTGGRLINHPNMVPVGIAQLLIDNHSFDPVDAAAIEEFLLHGLKYDPEERPSARDAISLRI